MDPNDILMSHNITQEFLSTLDKHQLIDLLQNRTALLLVAIKAKIQDKVYVTSLQKEVESIQKEINGRNS